MSGQARVSAGWALWGKRPGSVDDYSVLESSTAPLSKSEFARVIAFFAPGTPPAQRDLPGSLPWMTISRVGINDRLFVGIATQSLTGEIDGAGRPIMQTSYLCVPYEELANAPVSYASLYKQLASLQLPRKSDDLIEISVPRLDPEVLADDVMMRFSEPTVAATAALMLCGPVSIVGAESTEIEDRLRFLDAVAALLPYGYRAGYTASTWSDSGARHQIRLAFAARPRKDTEIVRWGSTPVRISNGSGDSYLRLLLQIRRRSPGKKALTDLIDFFAHDTPPRIFERPQYAVESLRNFDIGTKPFLI